MAEPFTQVVTRQKSRRHKSSLGRKILWAVLFFLYYGNLFCYCLIWGGAFAKALWVASTILPIWCALKLLVARFTLQESVPGDAIVRAYKDQDHQVVFLLENRGIFAYPVCWISYCRKDSTSPHGEEGMTACSLLPGKPHRLLFQLRYPYRGPSLLEVRQMEIATELPFLSWKKPLSLQAKVLVYPSIVPLSRFDASFQSNDEALYHADRMTDEITDYVDVREYQEQDALRSVHWKLSSRLENLVVRQFHEASEERACLYFDLTQTVGARTEETLKAEDKLAELCASSGYFLLENQVPFRFFYPFLPEEKAPGAEKPEIRHVECGDSVSFQYVYDLLASLPYVERATVLQAELLPALSTVEAAKVSVYLYTLCPTEALLVSVRELLRHGYPVMVFALIGERDAKKGKEVLAEMEAQGARVVRSKVAEDTREILEGIV